MQDDADCGVKPLTTPVEKQMYNSYAYMLFMLNDNIHKINNVISQHVNGKIRGKIEWKHSLELRCKDIM
jgi:hypothetical protein